MTRLRAARAAPGPTELHGWIMQSTFNYPEGAHQLKEMEDDASFLTSSYVVSILYHSNLVFKQLRTTNNKISYDHRMIAGFFETKQRSWRWRCWLWFAFDPL